MNSVTAGDIAAQDQEIAQAVHEADMIAHVYERLAKSLPEEFAQAMTQAWWLKPEPGEDSGCADCGEFA